ncbi:hypothetical protein AB0G15_05985 [Streptosporangium sp. NPDC023825]|uniref:hypothetical protein n=1 Tax=Streptosporangium sp. NPDC023825 TaxID=3154909 RepID=UPI0034496710
MAKKLGAAGGYSLSGSQLIDVGSPSDTHHAANQGYVDSAAASAVAAHEVEENPHTQYVTYDDAATLYAEIDHTHTAAEIGAETPAGAQAKADAGEAAAKLWADGKLADAQGYTDYWYGQATDYADGLVADVNGYTDYKVGEHAGAVDPHPQYVTATEGDAAYSAIGHNHNSAYATISHNHDSAYAALAHTHVGSFSPVYSVTGAVTTGAGTYRVYNDTGRTLTISSVRASVGTAPTGASLIVDVHKNGTTIFTTQSARPTIAVSTNTSKSTTMDVTTWADGDYLTVDVDQVGSTVAGANLTVQVVAG